MLGLGELLKSGGSLSPEDLTEIANKIYSGEEGSEGVGVLDSIQVIKQAFLRWKNANLAKFKQLEEVEHKDVEMLLEKIQQVQTRMRMVSEERAKSHRYATG